MADEQLFFYEKAFKNDPKTLQAMQSEAHERRPDGSVRGQRLLCCIEFEFKDNRPTISS